MILGEGHVNITAACPMRCHNNNDIEEDLELIRGSPIRSMLERSTSADERKTCFSVQGGIQLVLSHRLITQGCGRGGCGWIQGVTDVQLTLIKFSGGQAHYKRVLGSRALSDRLKRCIHVYVFVYMCACTNACTHTYMHSRGVCPGAYWTLLSIQALSVSISRIAYLYSCSRTQGKVA